jgi:16S rRNA (uracil1498-N3)-methyltransferase
MISMTARPAHRFWVDSPLAPGSDVELPDRAARHVAVLRLKERDAVTLFDGRGGEYEARLLRVGQKSTVARVGAWHDIERESPVAVTLALGISASDRMDYAVQKATELGVVEIVPLATARSVVRLTAERAGRRQAHWQAIASSACEQCGRNRVPRVHEVTEYLPFVSAGRGGARLLLSPEGEQRLRDIAASESCTLLIGAEGGLAPEELDRALKEGYVAMRFGPRILRTETAPLAVLSAIQASWGDC